MSCTICRSVLSGHTTVCNIRTSNYCNRFNLLLNVEINSLPPTKKLLKGNVFTGVCLFIGTGVSLWPLPMMHWTSLYLEPPPPEMEPGYVAPPPHLDMGPGYLPPLASYWHLVVINWDPPPVLTPSAGHQNTHRAVCILLGCFLVLSKIWTNFVFLGFS